MKNKRPIFYILFFVLILIVPTLFLNTRLKVRSELDNRYLVEFPSAEDPDFISGVEDYVKDRIGFRNQMIHVYDVINDVLFNELTHPTYSYGKDGYVFFNMHNNIKFGTFHKVFAETLLKLQRYVESRGSHFYFIFEPEKMSVYRQYLLEGVNYNDEWVDQLKSYMDELGVNYVDSGVVLKEKAKTEKVFDTKYDAGHWNDLGEFYATNQLLERIHQDVPEVKTLEKSSFEISQINARYLKNSEFVINETVPKYALKTEYEDVTKEWSDIVRTSPSFNHFHYYVNRSNGASVLPKALIFQGSYYNRAPEFFVPPFSECIGVHNYQNVLDIEYYFNLFDPDIVILDAAEYVFTDHYFNLSKMRGLDLAPSLDRSMEWASVPFIIKANLNEGELVDELELRIPFSDISNAWLVCGNDVYDLSRDSEGKYDLETMNGSISGEKDLKVYVRLSIGDRYAMSVDLRKTGELLVGPELSANTVITDETIHFMTQIEGNVFNAVEIQLYDDNKSTYNKLIKSIKSSGKAGFSYIHNEKSGYYCVRLKANSNIRDEYVDHIIYLEQAEKYDFSLTVNDISDKSIDISGFSMKGPLVP